jgi:TolB-like protein/Tfp pilus assembly protein PilF
MDFGAGREIGDTSQADLTGTPLYLAPEVLDGGAPTVQSDVYALGVLLYHLLTGGYPVSGRTIGEVREAHTAGTRVRLRRTRPDVPAALARVIERASDPVASRRYSSARALSADLSAISRRRAVRQLAAAALCSLVVGAAWTVERGAGDARGPRLAVLMFDGASSEDRTLAKGLTQEVQRNLAGLDGLMLLSFDSASRLPWGRDPVIAGRTLDADLVVDGSAVRSGDTLRVHARLVRVADAHVAWNNTYDRRIQDIFAIQDDISRAIADELRVTLRLPRRHAIGLDVYYEFLRAREVQSRRGEYYMRRAAELFEAVVARAPSYAPAWAAIATSLADEARLRDVPYPPRMKEAAHQAAQLDEFLAEAQQAMGNLFAADGRWRDADNAFRRAIEVDPSLTFTHTEFVLSSLLPQGRLDRALAVLAAAEERDPLSLDVRRVKALVEVEAGRYAQAIETAQWVLARDPEFPFANLWLGRALALSGRADEALRHYGQDPATAAYRGYALAVLGRTQEAEQLAAALSAEPHRQMLIYGGLGDTERAFAALERVVAQNRWRAATWMIRPEVARLRNDPRYAVMRDRLGLSDERPHWWRTILARLHVSN